MIIFLLFSLLFLLIIHLFFIDSYFVDFVDFLALSTWAYFLIC